MFKKHVRLTSLPCCQCPFKGTPPIPMPGELSWQSGELGVVKLSNKYLKINKTPSESNVQPKLRPTNKIFLKKRLKPTLNLMIIK